MVLPRDERLTPGRRTGIGITLDPPPAPLEVTLDTPPVTPTIPQDISDQLDVLKLTPEQAFEIHHGVNSEIQNPSNPQQKTIESYGFEEAIKTIFPDSTEDDLYGYISAYTLGGRLNRIFVEQPRQERYDLAVERLGRETEQFFSGLPDDVRDIFETAFEQGDPAAPFPDLGNTLAFDINALQRGETVSAAQRLYSAPEEDILDGNVPPGQENIAPAQTFDNVEDYLNFQLGEIQEAYPNLENLNSTEQLENYATLYGRALYLELTDSSNFELFQDNLQLARTEKTLQDVFAPARFVGEQAIRFGASGSTPDDLRDLINTADPELDSIADLQVRYRILTGRERYGTAGGEELFGITGADAAEAILDPYNLIPLGPLDDILKIFKFIPNSVARVIPASQIKEGATILARIGNQALVAGTETAVDGVRRAGATINAATVENLRSIIRTPVGQSFVNRVRNVTQPLRTNRLNVEGLQQAVGRALNDEYALELTNRVLSDDGTSKAGLIDLDRKLIRASYSIDDVNATVHHEVFHAVYPRLNDDLKQLIDTSFANVEEAAEAYGAYVTKRTTGSPGAKAFLAITDVLKQVREYFARRGYTSAEQVFGRIRSGDAYRDVAINANDAVVAYRDVPRSQRVNLVDGEGLTTPIEGFYEIKTLDDLTPAHRRSDVDLRIEQVADYPETYRRRHQTSASYENNLANRIAQPDDTLKSLVQRTQDYNRGSIIVSNTGEVLSGTQRYNLLDTLARRRSAFDSVVARREEALKANATSPTDETARIIQEADEELAALGLSSQQGSRDSKLLNNYVQSVEDVAGELGINRSLVKKYVNEGKIPILVRTVANPGDNLKVVRNSVSRAIPKELEVSSIVARVAQIKSEDLVQLNATFGRLDLRGKRLIDLLGDADSTLIEQVSGELRKFIPEELIAPFYNRSSGIINLNGLRYVSGVLSARLFTTEIRDSTDFLRRWLRPDTDFLQKIKPEFERRLGEFLDLRVKLDSKALDEKYDIFKPLAEVVRLQSRIRRSNESLADYVVREFKGLRLNSVLLSDQEAQGAALALGLDRITDVRVPEFFDGVFRTIRDREVRELSFSSYHPPFHYALLNKIAGRLSTDQAEVYERLLASIIKREDVPTEAFVAASDDLPGRAGLGQTTLEHQANSEILQAKTPEVTSILNSKIKNSDSTRVAARKLIKAVENGTVTDEEAGNILMYFNTAKDKLNESSPFRKLQSEIGKYRARNSVADSNGLLELGEIDRGYREVMKSIANNSGAREIHTASNLWEQHIYGQLDLSDVVEGFVFDEKTFAQGSIGEFGQRFLRKFGVSNTEARAITYAISQSADNFGNNLVSVTDVYRRSAQEAIVRFGNRA